MAKSAQMTLEPNTMTEITDGDVTAITVIHMGGAPVMLQGSEDTTAPRTWEDGFPLRFDVQSGSYLINRALSDLFPENSSFDRVFAYAVGGRAILNVKHA